MEPLYGYFRVGYSHLIEPLECSPEFSYIPSHLYTIKTKHGLDMATYISASNKTFKQSSLKSYDELSFYEDIITLLHPATKEEKEAHKTHQRESSEYLDYATESVKKMNLAMKIMRVYPFFTGEKIIFSFFSSKQKVDFRELARELGQKFRSKIELHKIYDRDFSGFLDGLGYCGKQLCCSGCKTHKQKNFKSEFLEGSSLGPCGKCLCCSIYEK